MKLASLIRDRSGATAGEFALVLPVLLVFLFGIIDAGRFLWEVNRAEKATQMGVRYAIATDLVPANLETYSFATGTQVTQVLQGSAVPVASFGGVTCTSAGCTNKGAGPTPGFDATAFANIVGRMNAMYPPIAAANVVLDYDNVGLGFAGDPNGADVAPLVTVKLQNLTFQPLTLLIFGQTISLPDFRAALTLEDGDGDVSN